MLGSHRLTLRKPDAMVGCQVDSLFNNILHPSFLVKPPFINQDGRYRLINFYNQFGHERNFASNGRGPPDQPQTA